MTRRVRMVVALCVSLLIGVGLVVYAFVMSALFFP
jgi:hypothetical protein